MLKRLLPALLFLLSLKISAQQGQEPVKVTDMLLIKSISGVTLSMDGSKAAFTLTTIEPEAENKWEYKYVNQLWMVNR